MNLASEELDLLTDEFNARGGMSTEELISRLDAVPFEEFQNGLKEKIQNYKVENKKMTLEEQIIGALLNDKDAYDKICDLLQLKHFKNPNVRRIYMAMFILKRRSLQINVHTIIEQMSKMDSDWKIEDPRYIAKLSAGVGSSKDIEEWARRLVLDWKEQKTQKPDFHYAAKIY